MPFIPTATLSLRSNYSCPSSSYKFGGLYPWFFWKKLLTIRYHVTSRNLSISAAAKLYFAYTLIAIRIITNAEQYKNTKNNLFLLYVCYYSTAPFYGPDAGYEVDKVDEGDKVDEVDEVCLFLLDLCFFFVFFYSFYCFYS